jgi:hypothetical protein
MQFACKYSDYFKNKTNIENRKITILLIYNKLKIKYK